MDERHFRRLENMARRAPICELTRSDFAFSSGKARVTFEVRPEFTHAAGGLHGALYFYGLDTAAYFAANTLIPECFLVTSSFTTYMTGAIASGRVVAEGEVVHQGRTQLIAEAVLLDERGRTCGRGNGVFVRSNIPLDEKIGYGD